MFETSSSRRRLLLGLAGLAGSAAVPLARAQSASRTLRIVVPYPAGGTQDAMMRMLQEPLAQLLGQTVIIDNRAGAAGMIGAQSVKQAQPDGSTLLLFNNGMAITPLIQRSANVDFARDMQPVSMVGDGPMVIFAHAATPITDIKGLIAQARAKPDSLAFASTGVGGLGHLTMAAFAHQAGIRLIHVPYKGNAPLMLAVVGGETPLGIGTVSDTMLQSIRAGKIKALGVTTRQSSPAMPGVPPISDSVPDFDLAASFAFLAPPGTPAKVVADTQAAIAKVLAQPDIRERYLAYGLVARASGPQEVLEMIQRESTQWRATVAAARIQVE